MPGGFLARAFDGRGFYTSVLIAQATGFRLGALAKLTAPQPFAQQTGIEIGASASLLGSSRLVAASDLRIAAAAELSIFTGLSGNSGLQIGVTPPRLTASSIDLNSGAPAFYVPLGFYPPAFGTGRPYAALVIQSTVALRAPVVFRTVAGLTVRVAVPFLQLPADWHAGAAIRVGTQADLVLKGPLATAGIIVIDGQPATARVGSVVIRDVINESTNTLECVIDHPATPPRAGQDIKVGLGSTLPHRLIFAGVIQAVDQSYTLKAAHDAWHVRATDYGVLLNRRLVWAEYVSVSATTIARTLVQTYAAGFTLNHVADGLPAISVSFAGVNLSVALTEIATQVGGYWYVDYGKDVHLFISETDPVTDPKAIDPVPPQHLNDPPIMLHTDHSQIRTRILVVGVPMRVLAPVRAGAAVIPLEDATPFAGGGTVQWRNGTRAPYTGTASGDAGATLVGNVPAPAGAPVPALAAVAGGLSGTYQWAVAFATAVAPILNPPPTPPVPPINPPPTPQTAQGETALGAISASLFCPTVAAPSGGVGIGPHGQGPLIGLYQYAVTFKTARGETLPGPISRRFAFALPGAAMLSAPDVGPSAVSRLSVGRYRWVTTFLTAAGETLGGPAAVADLTDLEPPGSCEVSTAAAPGVLPPGVPVAYRVTFVTRDGETAGGNPTAYTPPGFSGPAIQDLAIDRFGGLYGGPYSYAVSIVTAAGESGLLATRAAGSGFFTGAPATNPYWTGPSNDTNGRIAPGWTYTYAASYFSETYGETPLSATGSLSVGGVYPVRVIIVIPALVTGADGIRIYRRQADGAFTLNAEFKRGSVPASYYDVLAQGENGGTYPVQAQRAGVQMRVLLGAAPEAGVLARRLYRTKATGAEYFLVAEVQSNTAVYVYDLAFDQNLTTRNLPGTGVAGRQAALTAIPLGRVGVTGRRLYRTRANSAASYLVGELKDNTTTTWIDNVGDQGLTVAMPGINTAGARYLSAFQPRLTIPTGPTDVRARRVYRTTGNGPTLRLLFEIPDNLTTSVVDDTPDGSLGAQTVPTDTGVGEAHAISSLPIGPAGTLARRLYRTAGNGLEFRLVLEVDNNTETSTVDAVADANLGPHAPLTGTAGASAVMLSGIPLGPPDVTQRFIYRTPGTGGAFQYVGAIPNNTETTFLDDRADTSLGRPPQATSTIGALSGEPTLTLDTVAGFPPAGWVDVGGVLVSYTAISGTTLIGIPGLGPATITRSGAVAILSVASGQAWVTGDTVVIVGVIQPEYAGAHVVTVTSPTTATYPVSGAPVSPATGTIRVGLSGALTREVAGGALVRTVPMLTGVSNLATPRTTDETVALFVICNDAAAQASLAALEGGDGIHEATISDPTLTSNAACVARGNAELVLFARPQVEVTYATHDPKTRSGKPITINLPSLGMTASLKILDVTIDEIDVAARLYPRCTVKAASAKFSLTDLLRHAVLDV